MQNQAPPTLYLRIDGTLMLARSDGTDIEMQLAPSQLVQLGFDFLQVAIKLQPACLPEVLHALEHTTVMVPVDTPEAAPCQLSLN
jgi:hypothetical protein